MDSITLGSGIKAIITDEKVVYVSTENGNIYNFKADSMNDEGIQTFD